MTLLDLVVPAGLDPWVVGFLLAVSVCSSFITIAFGIGGGVLLIAVLASLVPPLALVPIHGVVQFGSNIGRAVFMYKFVSWQDVGMITLGSLVGVAIGGAIAFNLPPALVQLGVGLFVIWSVFMTPPRWLNRWPFIAGVISSFLTMFFGATGPFVATFTKSLKLDRHRHVATHGTIMAVQNLLKSIMFAILGFLFAPWAGFIVAMIAAGAVGTFAGRQVLNRLSDDRFRIALNTILVLLSLQLVWGGLRMLWTQYA